MKDDFSLEIEADIYLLGSGVRSFLDITLLTQKILRECHTVFYLQDLRSVERYLASITRRPVNLNSLYYLEGRERADIYRDIVNHVVREAKTVRPIGVLSHGHPLVFSDISRGILAEGRKMGLKVEIIPAVSSLDRIFVDLELDIGLRGLQILEATAVILNEVVINPRIDCLLYQIGGLLNPRASRNRVPTSEEVLPLKAYLKKFYPDEHRATIVASSVELGFETGLTEVPLGRLEKAAHEFTYGASLYIPALSVT